MIPSDRIVLNAGHLAARREQFEERLEEYGDSPLTLALVDDLILCAQEVAREEWREEREHLLAALRDAHTMLQDAVAEYRSWGRIPAAEEEWIDNVAALVGEAEAVRPPAVEERAPTTLRRIRLDGADALLIDPSRQIVAVDGVSGQWGINGGPEWRVLDLRGGMYGDFHRLLPAEDCTLSCDQHIDDGAVSSEEVGRGG